jgi:hypothetical protein
MTAIQAMKTNVLHNEFLLGEALTSINLAPPPPPPPQPAPVAS